MTDEQWRQKVERDIEVALKGLGVIDVYGERIAALSESTERLYGKIDATRDRLEESQANGLNRLEKKIDDNHKETKEAVKVAFDKAQQIEEERDTKEERDREDREKKERERNKALIQYAGSGALVILTAVLAQVLR